MSVLYRSVNDLHRDIQRWSPYLPNDIAAVSGVPRSGILPAALLAEHLHVPLLPIEVVMGSCAEAYRPEISRKLRNLEGRILVLDDSSWTGKTMLRVKPHIKSKDVLYGAVYGSDLTAGQGVIDVRGFVLPDILHSFAWLLGREWLARHTLYDCDGVLCTDWGKPDEGPEWTPLYEQFLVTVKPLVIPTKEILGIVTSRLSKYRKHTEAWLRQNQISYKGLYMAEYATAKERNADDGFVGHKANHYIRMKDEAKFFVESDYRQAKGIAERTGLPVLCYETQTMFNGREPEPCW